MDDNLGSAMDRYAALLVRNGVNLQEGQSLRIVAELEHAELVRLVTAHAYQAGARYVHVDWTDTPTTKQRLLHSRREFLDYLPDYEVERHRYMTDNEWTRLSLVGPEFDIFADTDPNAMRRVTETRAQAEVLHGSYDGGPDAVVRGGRADASLGAPGLPRPLSGRRAGAALAHGAARLPGGSTRPGRGLARP